MSALCNCLDEFGANPPNDPCALHGADEVPICRYGSEWCGDGDCCARCDQDAKDDAAIEREEQRREDAMLDHDAGHWWEP